MNWSPCVANLVCVKLGFGTLARFDGNFRKVKNERQAHVSGLYLQIQKKKNSPWKTKENKLS